MKSIYDLIFEQDDNEKAAKRASPENPILLRRPKVRARPASDSVDDQIDGLILRYESASIRSEEEGGGEATLAESLKKLNLRFLLEQEEEEPVVEEEETVVEEEEPVVDEAEGEEGEEDETPDPEGSEAMAVTEPIEEQEIPDLDVDRFAARVIRLLMNHDNLLRIEDAIINRTKNFLDENYGDVFVSKFLDIIEEQYGLAVDEFPDVEYDEDEPFAVGAFAGGTGGLGGGGG